MLDRQTSPLEIAERILKPETLRLIAEAEISISAKKLLDTALIKKLNCGRNTKIKAYFKEIQCPI